MQKTYIGKKLFVEYTKHFICNVSKENDFGYTYIGEWYNESFVKAEIADIEGAFMCLLLTANVSFYLQDIQNKYQSLLFGAIILSWIYYLHHNLKLTKNVDIKSLVFDTISFLV